MSTTIQVASEPRQWKRKRGSRACDRCHRNACKCSPGIDGTTCIRCEEQGVACTYNRPAKRRGPPSRRARMMGDAAATTSADDLPPVPPATDPRETSGTPSSSRVNADAVPAGSVSTPPTSLDWAFERVIDHEKIETLIEVFYHSAYPLRPYFHWPTFQSQIHQQLYRSNRGFFVVTMAVCAMAAGRLCDGVPLPSTPHPLLVEAAALFADCYSAAIKAIPSDITEAEYSYEMMKGKAILASVCLQNGDLRRAMSHLGDYITLSNITGFNVEANWPSNLSELQIQERRRLFWGAYQQDQYISNNFGFVSRLREAKSSVQYPAEVFDDEDITETRIHLRPDRVSFLRGWNFCTDLYRLLEHMDDTVRTRQQVPPEEPGATVSSFLSYLRSPKHFASDTLHLISKLHADLPDELKKVKTITGDARSDRYGFIAANVLITTQTLKMLLVGNGKPNVHLRCAIASELLDELSAIPIAFFHASSTVSLHHLAHVGYLLGSVIQNPLSAWTYLQVRNILLVLADFLEKIEASRASAPGLAAKLRKQIQRIDQYMKHNSVISQESGMLSIGQKLLSDWSNYTTNIPPPVQDDDGQQQLSRPPMDKSGSSFQMVPTSPVAPRSTQMFNNHGQQSPRLAQLSSGATQIRTDSFQDPSEPVLGNSFQMSNQEPFSTAALTPAVPAKDHSSLPNDFLDNWPFMLGQTDPLESTELFATLGVMPQEDYRRSLSRALVNEGHGQPIGSAGG